MQAAHPLAAVQSPQPGLRRRDLFGSGCGVRLRIASRNGQGLVDTSMPQEPTRLRWAVSAYVATALSAGLAMLFTGMRHFRH